MTPAADVEVAADSSTTVVCVDAAGVSLGVAVATGVSVAPDDEPTPSEMLMPDCVLVAAGVSEAIVCERDEVEEVVCVVAESETFEETGSEGAR